MLPGLEVAEREMSEIFGGREVVLTCKCTSAITLVLRSIGVRGGEVLVPALVCPDVLYGVLFAGLRPVLVDVSSDDYNIDVQSVEERISTKTRAIVAVHLFGHPCRLQEIYELAEQHGIRVIEDCAQSIGGESGGRLLGSYGDISVFSFGDQKILDCGGGGALVTDDKALASKVRLVQSTFPAEPSSMVKGLTSLFYMGAYHSAIKAEAYSARFSSALLGIMPALLRKVYLFRPDNFEIGRLNSGLSKLGQEKEIRVRNASMYRKLLSHPAVRHPPIAAGANFYMYSVLVNDPNLRNRLVAGLRRQGFRASMLYPPIDDFLGIPNAQTLPNSHFVGSRIVNFPVEPGINEEYIQRCAAAANEILGSRCSISTGTGAGGQKPLERPHDFG